MPNSVRTTDNTSLDVFLTPSICAVTSDVPPGETERPWPPISSTLISGERDAVLVDSPITIEQSRPREVASGKNLTAIYATHGHGDHFLGTSAVLERFPGARFVARAEVIEVMREQASAESLETFWNPRFPGQIASQLVIAEELTGNVIHLEGHDLVSVPLGLPTPLAQPAFMFERLVVQATTARDYMTRCSSCTLTGSIEVRSGPQCAP